MQKGEKVMADLTKLLTAAAKKGATVPSEHVDMMWSTLVTGIVVVFLILLLLVFVLWALGKVMNINIKKKPKYAPQESAKQPSAPAAVPNAASAETEAETEYDEDDGEIIAVIAAAIAAYGEADGKQYRIASVKRKEKALRSNWGAAGVNENTRPF